MRVALSARALWSALTKSPAHLRPTADLSAKRVQPRSLLRVGIVGSVVAAICCFTPALVVLLGIAGLSATVGWLDYVLLPSLALFVGITLYALIKVKRA